MQLILLVPKVVVKQEQQKNAVTLLLNFKMKKKEMVI